MIPVTSVCELQYILVKVCIVTHCSSHILWSQGLDYDCISVKLLYIDTVCSFYTVAW